MKVVIENLQQKNSTVSKEKTEFNKKFELLSIDLKSKLIEKQGLLESFKRLEAENEGLKKYVNDNEAMKSMLQEQIAKQDESFQLMLKENEVLKYKIEKKKKKLFCF